jgi:hypothetical protein
MTQHLSEFSVFFGYMLDMVLLICCFIFCYKKTNSTLIKRFPVFAFSNILGDVCYMVGTHLKDNEPNALVKACHFIFSLIPLFELIFFTYVLFQLVQSTLAKKFTQILNFLFFIVFTFFLISVFLNRDEILALTLFEISTLIESICIMMLCFIFFKEVFKEPYSRELTKYQSFWLVSGILFYFSLRIPAFLFSGYFIAQKNLQTANIIFSVYNYSEIIPYTLFIKAMTCRIKQ